MGWVTLSRMPLIVYCPFAIVSNAFSAYLTTFETDCNHPLIPLVLMTQQLLGEHSDRPPLLLKPAMAAVAGP